MSHQLETLISAVILVCRYSEDQRRAERVLEIALKALVNDPASPPAELDQRTDAMGAPLASCRDPEQWETLRQAVKIVAGEVGWPEAARRYGGNQQALKDLVYRQRLPGAGRQARLLRVVAGTDTRH